MTAVGVPAIRKLSAAEFHLQVDAIRAQRVAVEHAAREARLAEPRRRLLGALTEARTRLAARLLAVQEELRQLRTRLS